MMRKIKSTDFSMNHELIRDILVRFIRDETKKSGFNKAVVGLSGGIDSAVGAYLAVHALGKKNVKALRLPYRTSPATTIDHANLVINDLGIESETIEISAMVDPLYDQFPEMSRTRKGNIMARQRMIVLYDQSAAFGGLVVGTSNKTEILMGYSTVFGDSAAAFHPIGDLYKTQVWDLARFLDVPEVIINKPPSADFWPGQTDEAELGFSYEMADHVLYLLVDNRYKKQEVIDAGYDPDLVEKIYERMRRMHFKRVMPLIPKLSTRTIGIDFLYLRDWSALRKS